METDDGVSGWGEPVVEGRAATVRAAVHELAGYLVGKDPARIEDQCQVGTKGTFYRGGPILARAVAGVDQAVWDIAGKALGVPVHHLLAGHVRDRIRMYTWIGGDDPDDVAAQAKEAMSKGFTAVKMNACGALRAVDTSGDHGHRPAIRRRARRHRAHPQRLGRLPREGLARHDPGEGDLTVEEVDALLSRGQALLGVVMKQKDADVKVFDSESSVLNDGDFYAPRRNPVAPIARHLGGFDDDQIARLAASAGGRTVRR